MNEKKMLDLNTMPVKSPHQSFWKTRSIFSVLDAD